MDWDVPVHGRAVAGELPGEDHLNHVPDHIPGLSAFADHPPSELGDALDSLYESVQAFHSRSKCFYDELPRGQFGRPEPGAPGPASPC